DAQSAGECVFRGWKVELNVNRTVGSPVSGIMNWQESAQCRANARLPTSCSITDGLQSNTFYDIRITEICVDPNAIGPTLTMYDIVRTRPLRATVPKLVNAYAASARSVALLFYPGIANECIFQGWAMEWKLEGTDFWTMMERCMVRTSPTTCLASDFPQSQSYYRVRIQEKCEDFLAEPEMVTWPLAVLTWPEPAQPPTNVTIVTLTAYNLTFSFEPGDPLDCTWATWRVQIILGWDHVEKSRGWYDVGECQPQLPNRYNVTCSITGLSSFTQYQLRVKETCSSYIYDSAWGLSPLFRTNTPIPAGPPEDVHMKPGSLTAFFFDLMWKAGAEGQCIFKTWVMQVREVEGTEAFLALPQFTYAEIGVFATHACIVPRDAPQCRPGALPLALKMNGTYDVRVKETCTDPNADGEWTVLDHTVTTLVATTPATAPENLTVRNDTAYTFLLEYDPGQPGDCYFTGWDVEVRENWTEEINATNDTNITFLNRSDWVQRIECRDEDVFPRAQKRCIVPRLRKHSIYDARVRETCYEGYYDALQSDFSYELPDRQAETLVPVAATLPSGIGAANPGPYSFSVSWTPGDPNDCVYTIWLVEINALNFTGGKWAEADECGREPRPISRCIITRLSSGYLGPEAHLKSNTEYAVRVKEYCETYTSIYDSRGRERALYLDSPRLYLPAAMEPRTLVPIPTLPPLDFAVSEEDQTSFRLDWTPQVSNDCLFRNWTIEVQLDTHCISGSGYTTCTPVLNQNWTIVPSCTLTTRTEVNCKAYNLQSYSFYAVRIKEGCSDATAESAYATTRAEIWPAHATVPENLTITSPTPFSFLLKWGPGDPNECVFAYWDVRVRERRVGSVFNRWYGPVLAENDTNVTFGETVASCRLVGQRELAECTVDGLVSDAIYDVEIKEQCVDVRAQSAWTVQ
ncbi:unnamed protein product, partial [Polarella glacialis]